MVLVLSAASIFFLSPFLAFPGAEVRPITTSMLASGCVLAMLWARASALDAASKGDRVRAQGLSAVVSVLFIALLLVPGRMPLTYESRGTAFYTHEGALASMVLGVAGALGPIVVACLPDRWRPGLGASRSDAPSGPTRDPR